MNKGKVISLIVATGLTATLLTGCDNTNTFVVGDVKTESRMEQVVVEEQTEAKVFAPYEHIYFKRYDLSNNHPENITGGQVMVPEGYEILDIEPFAVHFGNLSESVGFDVWFINNQEVEAKSIYNKEFGYYDFSEPGIVTQKEIETEKSLKLIK